MTFVLLKMEKRSQKIVRFAEVRRRVGNRSQRSVWKGSGHVREIANLANRAFRQAAQSAMVVSGFVVVAENDWVVKKFQDGRIERISPIEKINRPKKLVLR
ncbi:MAG TPA: hypothetical protein PKY12_16020 [Catalimonadaceae bacterium]|nr:hypothetical protein [Catalimonadaceae bacterium]